MPTIYDNIETPLLPILRQTLTHSYRADICVGYFNLRGWACIRDFIEHFDGSDNGRARVLIGMVQAPEEDMRRSLKLLQRPEVIDGPRRSRLLHEVAASFREQLETGAPSNTDEATLRCIARQIRSGKLRVKLFLGHPLHAKLYLGFRQDHASPILGYLGSSNLTASGLSHQGELNVDVLEQDAAKKLAAWFQDRWEDLASEDISEELAALIETSWAREKLLSPYLVYLKMAYHLSQEAREGEQEFKLPKVFKGQLLDFQAAAVSLAVRHLNTRNGVLVGDVVGLGKTRVAAAVARIYQEDQDGSALILCPKNLVGMWEQQVALYELNAEVLSVSRSQQRLPELRRHKLVIIDESHNLRNREGKRYQVIRDYIDRNDSKVVLLTATPYNKQYLDLSNQLRLFVDEKRDIGIRPEKYFEREPISDLEFDARFQAPSRSLLAFEKSEDPEDWRNLMRLFLVRRTRHFIIQNYAQYDPARDRYFVSLEQGNSYFPKRQPKNLTFALNDADPQDQYARLYQASVVEIINALCLPRYGLANYQKKNALNQANAREKQILENLGRAGPRLMGFCRTNLFKRLESSGYSFLVSLDRHLLRNLVTLHAIQTNQPIPIGTQESEPLDTSRTDTDGEFPDKPTPSEEYTQDSSDDAAPTPPPITIAIPSASSLNLPAYQKRAAEVYDLYRTQYQSRFKWIAPHFFVPALAKDLLSDAQDLLGVLQQAGFWDPARDAKLDALRELLCRTHAKEKVLIFTQFADSVRYLETQLIARGVQDLAGVTAATESPTLMARRFSPVSNQFTPTDDQPELRVLVATDTLSEGQNLQDAAIVVNYDLPWAIIRLIQRAGRVDRIGQQSDTILVYSFLPAVGVERVIGLQRRLQERLRANQEVVGADEAFFGESEESKIRDLYTEKAKVLEDDPDGDVDLGSEALQIWKNAEPAHQKQVEALPNVVYATKPHGAGRGEGPPGVLVYLKYPDGTDALVRTDPAGNILSQSLASILQTAACDPKTPGLPRHEQHHALVQEAVQKTMIEQHTGAGAMGPPRSARRRAHERLISYREQLKRKPDLFVDLNVLEECLQALHKLRLTNQATDQINRQLRLGINDADLAQVVMTLHEAGKLSIFEEEPAMQEPTVLCSLGMFPAAECQEGQNQ
ncbi:MAG: NgoFVII family restriction endonuclease [Armatimonadetes bacterium]|nr:NgoFVII family restriction endonuclease [Armatimonadota bacterium]